MSKYHKPRKPELMPIFRYPPAPTPWQPHIPIETACHPDPKIEPITMIRKKDSDADHGSIDDGECYEEVLRGGKKHWVPTIKERKTTELPGEDCVIAPDDLDIYKFTFRSPEERKPITEPEMPVPCLYEENLQKTELFPNKDECVHTVPPRNPSIYEAIEWNEHKDMLRIWAGRDGLWDYHRNLKRVLYPPEPKQPCQLCSEAKKKKRTTIRFPMEFINHKNKKSKYNN